MKDEADARSILQNNDQKARESVISLNKLAVTVQKGKTNFTVRFIVFL